MTSTRSMAGTGLHFPPSMATDDQGVIKPAPREIVVATAAAVEPAELLPFARRLLNGVRRRGRQQRWSAVNAQRVELAQLCITRALSEPVGSGLIPA